MGKLSRRGFIQAAAAVAVASGANFRRVQAVEPEPMRMGLLVSATGEPEKVMAYVRGFGIPTVHVSASSFSPAMARRLRTALDDNGIRATALVSSGPGEQKYDLYEGPVTYGLVAAP